MILFPIFPGSFPDFRFGVEGAQVLHAGMAIRTRLTVLIGLVLLVSMLLGAVSAGYQVREALKAELTSALTGARQTVASAFEDLPRSDHAARDLHQLISTFDGNRHVRATLVGEDGKVSWTSRTQLLVRQPPRWFRAVLGPVPGAVMIPVPAEVKVLGFIALAPTAELDVEQAWREFVNVALVISASTALGLIFVYLVIGEALRPLSALATHFNRIGTGDYDGRLSEDGPSELFNLIRGFNLMAAELAVTTGQNQLLANQLLTIQEEERADIARDLHDEIGPHLFAVTLAAQMIAEVTASTRNSAVITHVKAIQGAVGHVQQQVRDLLSRLRPTSITELGLNFAIEELVRFWATRRPGMVFELRLLEDESCLSDPAKEVVYRIIQESTNNAVRHGDPALVTVTMDVRPNNWLDVSIVDNGTIRSEPGKGTGMGLVGMRERVSLIGGVLKFGPNADGVGWTTIASVSLGPVTSRSLIAET